MDIELFKVSNLNSSKIKHKNECHTIFYTTTLTQFIENSPMVFERYM